MNTTGHHALFVNDRGGLELRRYPTGAAAARVASEREVPGPGEIDHLVGPARRGDIRAGVFARRLGISSRHLRRVYKRGGLPGAKEHGPKILMIPVHLLRLAEKFGLRQVERMAEKGLLPE